MYSGYHLLDMHIHSKDICRVIPNRVNPLTNKFKCVMRSMYVYAVNIRMCYVLLCTGVAHRLYHPTVSMSFLNDTGDIINTPSLPYTCEPSVSVPEPSNITNDLGMYFNNIL